jgi:Skp family chaperone for outer membrane proteins
MMIDFLFNLVASLANAFNHEKGLEAKLSASNKALEEAKTRLAAAEAKRIEGVAAVEARASKAEKALAEANQRQSKREQAVLERIDALSTSFGCKCRLAF